MGLGNLHFSPVYPSVCVCHTEALYMRHQRPTVTSLFSSSVNQIVSVTLMDLGVMFVTPLLASARVDLELQDSVVTAVQTLASSFHTALVCVHTTGHTAVIIVSYSV